MKWEKLYPHTEYGETNRQWLKRMIFQPYKKEPKLSGPRNESNYIMAPIKRGRSRTARSGGWIVKKPFIVAEQPKSLVRRKSMSVGRAKPVKTARKVRGKRFRSGYYKGKATGKMRRPKISRFSRNGTVARYEITGTIDDIDCVYLKAEACPGDDMIRAVVACLVRKTLEKAGLQVISWDATPQSLVPGDTVNAATDELNTFFTLYQQNIDTQAITSLATWSMGNTTFAFKNYVENLVPYFKDFVAGSGVLSTDNKSKLYGMGIHDESHVVGGGVNSKTVRSALILSQCLVEVKSILNIKFQNRTVSSTSGTEADDVGSNPLKGYIYEFDGIPKPRVSGEYNGALVYGGSSSKFEQYWVGQYGVRSFSPSAMDASYKEPPMPSSFWNCKKSMKCVLQPGHIKSYAASDGYKLQPVERILKQLHVLVADAASDFYFYGNKKNIMFAFEDVIGVNANQIFCAFEAERTISSNCVEKKVRFMLPRLEHASFAEY